MTARKRAPELLASDFCDARCEAKCRTNPPGNPEFIRVYRNARKCLWCWEPARQVLP